MQWRCTDVADHHSSSVWKSSDVCVSDSVTTSWRGLNFKSLPQATRIYPLFGAKAKNFIERVFSAAE